MIELGDMSVLATPPAKLAKALAVIAEYLHPEFARQPWIAGPDKSKECCVLCSLAVRDFLRAIGYQDARVRPAILVVRAKRDDTELHSVGVGVPGKRPEPGCWNGHMVVTIPSIHWLIDTTVYQAIRPAWPTLSGMVALPCFKRSVLRGEYRLIASAGMEEGPYLAGIMWFANPRNSSWKDGGDARPERRVAVVGTMIEKFHPWNAAA
jgi:hypothetical protein